MTFSNVTTGNYTVNWNRPAGTSNIYVQVDGGGYGSPVGGTSQQYAGSAGSSHTVVVWACSIYGCSKTSRSVTLLNPPQPRIVLVKSGPGPQGYWYGVTLSAFPPNTSVELQCHDSKDANFYRQNFSIDGAGNAGDSQLCYSIDGPNHWVTGGGATSNNVQWN